MIKVSVVVPVYETQQYLPKCFDSIINQTLKEIEIIVINDGSPDNSQEIIDRYQTADNRIRAVAVPNRGVSEARNLGIELAQGEYILMIDSDDYLDVKMLELMYAAIVKNNCDMCVCNYSRVFGGKAGPPYIRLPKAEIISPLDNNALFIKKIFSEEEGISGSVWNKLFNTSLLKNANVHFLDRKHIFAEDTLFMYEILPVIKNFCIVDLPLYYYYQRSASVSNTYKTDLLPRYKGLLNETIRYYQSLSLYEHVKEGIYTKSFIFFIETLHNEYMIRPQYKNLLTIFQDTFMRDMIKNANVTHLSNSKKLIYYLYKMRLYAMIYWIFRFYHKKEVTAHA